MSKRKPDKTGKQGGGAVATYTPEPVNDLDGAEPTPTFAAGLYLVATPIGNSRDITLRALDILTAADVIACEDTRVTAKLLARHNISRPLLAYHEHNAGKAGPGIIRRLKNGEIVALVSDAGTPIISDPGYRLVAACVAEGLYVTHLPGPSSALTGLVLSGLPADRFMFAGFPPVKSGKRRTFLEEVKAAPSTLIFLESPKRLAASLADMAAVLGDRPAAIGRELTKMFEEVRRGKLNELADYYRLAGPPRGEVTVIVGPPAKAAAIGGEQLDGLLAAALRRASVRDATAEVAAATGVTRREVYARALALAEKK